MCINRRIYIALCRILELVRTAFAACLPVRSREVKKGGGATRMTISSFSNELIITHFKVFFNLKIIEKYFGWRQILCTFKFKKKRGGQNLSGRLVSLLLAFRLELLLSLFPAVAWVEVLKDVMPELSHYFLCSQSTVVQNPQRSTVQAEVVGVSEVVRILEHCSFG